mgnify:CR=1 FL=1
MPEADYDVVVFENRFPSLTERTQDDLGESRSPQETRHGFGRCEVVCFTSAHGSSRANVTPDRIALVREAWIDEGLATWLTGDVLETAFPHRFSVVGRYFGGLVSWRHLDVRWSRLHQVDEVGLGDRPDRLHDHHDRMTRSAPDGRCPESGACGPIATRGAARRAAVTATGRSSRLQRGVPLCMANAHRRS